MPFEKHEGLTAFGKILWMEVPDNRWALNVPAELKDQLIKAYVWPKHEQIVPRMVKAQHERKRRQRWTKEMTERMTAMLRSGVKAREVTDHVLSTPFYGSRTRIATRRTVFRLAAKLNTAQTDQCASSSSGSPCPESQRETSTSSNGSTHDTPKEISADGPSQRTTVHLLTNPEPSANTAQV